MVSHSNPVARDDDASHEPLAVLADAGYGSVPLAFTQSGLHDLGRFACSHILRRVENRRVGLTDHFLRSVAIQAPSPFVPQQDSTVQILPDDGVLGGRFEDVLQKGRQFAAFSPNEQTGA